LSSDEHAAKADSMIAAQPTATRGRTANFTMKLRSLVVRTCPAGGAVVTAHETTAPHPSLQSLLHLRHDVDQRWLARGADDFGGAADRVLDLRRIINRTFSPPTLRLGDRREVRCRTGDLHADVGVADVPATLFGDNFLVRPVVVVRVVVDHDH